MKNRIALLLLVLCGMSTAAPAAVLSLEPPGSTVTAGSFVSLDLVVSGLGDMIAPSLGGFDIDLFFDPTLLTLTAITPGMMLGDIGAGEALDIGFGEFAPGLFNVAVVSLLAPGALDGMQPEAFVLATLEFLVGPLGSGTTTVVGVAGVFGLTDGFGMPLPLDAVADAELTGAVIPVPAAVWLMIPALLALGSFASRPPHRSDRVSLRAVSGLPHAAA